MTFVLLDSLSSLTRRFDSLYSTVLSLKKRERIRKKELSTIKSYIKHLEGLIQRNHPNAEIGKQYGHFISILESNIWIPLIDRKQIFFDFEGLPNYRKAHKRSAQKNFCTRWIEKNKRKISVAPKVVQITPWKVRINLKELSNADNCTEYFLIRSWKSTEPNNTNLSRKLSKSDGYSLDIKVDPGVLYNFTKLTFFNVNDNIKTDSRMKNSRKSKLKVETSNAVTHKTMANQPKGT